MVGNKTPSIKASGLLELIFGLYDSEDISEALSSQLISLATFRRVNNATTEEVVHGLIAGFEDSDDLSDQAKGWISEQRDGFVALLGRESVRLPAKALHLSTDQ